MEALSRLLARARDGGYISGFDVGRVNYISISHLLFADDTLIMCGALGNNFGTSKVCLVGSKLLQVFR